MSEFVENVFPGRIVLVLSLAYRSITIMYEPIHEVAPATNEVQLLADPSKVAESKLHLALRFFWQSFVTSFACASLVFGLYIASFHLQSIVRNQKDVWDLTGPGLYRKDCEDCNWALAAHFVGGCYIMLVGPLQFLKSIRRKWMAFHRWNGRLVVAGTLLTSMGGSYYVCAGGSANVPIIGQPANWNNLIFGLAMLVCGLQTYRHAAITKRIDLHKLWAYRIASLGLGSIYIRIGTSAMSLALHLSNPDPEVVENNLVHSKVFQDGLTFLVWTNHIPFLLMAGEVWKREQKGGETKPLSILFLLLAGTFLLMFVLGVIMVALVAWIPFIGRDLEHSAGGVGGGE